MAREKQAVILIHGMGEQTPLQTLRGFVEAVWAKNDSLLARRNGIDPGSNNPVWYKPDARTGSLELSRITTRSGKALGAPAPRTDFYEFYWADLAAGNTLDQLRDWFINLLVRRPYQVPPKVKSIWFVLWTLTLTFGFLSAWIALNKAGLVASGPTGWMLVLYSIGLAIYGGIVGFLVAYFGDVARYCRAKPPNIAARRAIRERGLTLIKAIADSGEYKRIVLVGHSLGTIVGYELIKYLWSERGACRTMVEGDAIHRAVEAVRIVGKELGKDGAMETYRKAQSALFDAMRARNAMRPEAFWPISDFVTLGSPLTHAQFLLERDAERLALGKVERRWPTSPPVEEGDQGFLYQPKGPRSNEWQIHHAAPFAAVRWTNIYDEPRAVLVGDFVSGPVQGNFGLGVEDIKVTMRRKWSTTHILLLVFAVAVAAVLWWSLWPWQLAPALVILMILTLLLSTRIFTHVDYWNMSLRADLHVEQLRTALDLARA